MSCCGTDEERASKIREVLSVLQVGSRGCAGLVDTLAVEAEHGTQKLAYYVRLSAFLRNVDAEIGRFLAEVPK